MILMAALFNHGRSQVTAGSHLSTSTGRVSLRPAISALAAAADRVRLRIMAASASI
jgi:hypothetical protein